MGCCCRLLFLALLLLPAGLGHGSPESPLIPIRPPLLWGGAPVKPDSRDVPTAAPSQPELPSSTAPSGDATSSRPLDGDGRNASTPAAALSPAAVPVSPAADGPSVSPSAVPPDVPAPRTAHAAGLARSTTDVGAAPSPSGLAVPSPPSSLTSSHPASPPGTGLSPTPVLASPAATRPPLPPEDVPSLGTLAVASSLATEPTSPPGTVLSAAEGEAEASEKTTGVTVEEVPRALSAGSIVAITVTVIVLVVLVFGAAAYLKIRHSSYGRLLDDHDYGSWGNYNNPLYDDS
ncbi:prostate androgen-regulated mucin-like protein 1 [Onychostruthus taczanowskii]|uniref:prostate androgen-regulated mucin-like protein 1 n=1 Tax=Onychostruthus taczanowskii TaxID=356909 RepID=UPI001B8048CF|nr:prostate androgen-regulated mucin-like protein 1 [Onychostruthus taczanowskii]